MSDMPAPVSPSTSNSISRSAAKPIISRSSSASVPYSSIKRSAIISSVIMVTLGWVLLW